MAILNAIKTTADYQAQTKSQITTSINSLYRQMVNTYSNCMDKVWANPNLTPQEVLKSFGTDGGALFTYASGLASLVNSITPNTLVSASGIPAITFNNDGSVTVGA